jgi:hypothetical protein
MARMARIKVDGEAAAYHVYGRIASFKGDYAHRKHLIVQLEGIHMSLREQRCTAVGF